MDKSQLISKIIRATPSLYLLQYYTIKGKPITFKSKDPVKHRPWQQQIIDDKHPNKVVRKSRQLGMSELGVAEQLWFTDVHPNVKSMFVFPRAQQTKDFVKTRVNPVLQNNKYFSSILDPEMDSLEVKKIRNSFMLFRAPGKNGALGEGADVDYLSLDEYDRMNPGIEIPFLESMSSSRYGMLRRWSTPTVPGRGVDELYQKSDQWVYLHRCDACNHWNELSIEDNILQVDPDGVDYINEVIKPGTFKFVCSKCKKELNRWEGQWVQKRTAKQYDIRGYHISQLNAAWISADRIMARSLQFKSRQLFHNYVLGEPYMNEGLLISEDDVLGAIRFPEPKTNRNEYVRVVAGIDWGTINWCVLLGLKENGQVDLLNLWWFKDVLGKPLYAVEQIVMALTPYNPDMIIADEGYGADRNSYLMQRFKGKTWACRFVNYKGKSQPMDKWNENQRLVVVDKTLKVQRLIHTIKSQTIGFWRIDEKMSMLIKHLKNMRLMDVEDDETGEVYVEYSRAGDDHLAASLIYGMVGIEKYTKPFKKRTKNTFWFDFI